MENVQKLTRERFFILKFYPKVRELQQFQNCDRNFYQENIEPPLLFSMF